MINVTTYVALYQSQSAGKRLYLEGKSEADNRHGWHFIQSNTIRLYHYFYHWIFYDQPSLPGYLLVSIHVFAAFLSSAGKIVVALLEWSGNV